MPIFRYKAIAPGGETKAGVIDADTARDARQRLRKEQLLVSEIHEASGVRRRAPDENARNSAANCATTTN